MNSANLSLFWGVSRYEFRMQVRRPAVWLLILIVGLLVATLFTGVGKPTDTDMDMLVNRTFSFSLYLPLTLGILLADRTPREKRLNTTELMGSLPVGIGTRLWGKYLGSLTATLLPILGVYLAEITYLAIRRQNLTLIPLEIPIFALVTLPGLLFIGAFSIVCTEVLAPPLYSVLFIGYWFWGNLIQPEKMPTLTCSLLTPSGINVRAGLFGITLGSCPNVHLMTPLQSWMSIALLSGMAILVLGLTQVYLTWRATRL